MQSYVERSSDPLSLDSADLIRLMTGSHGLEIRDRYHHFRRYRACFVGSELVDLLVSRYPISRRKATRIGQRLLSQEHIRHVAGEHDFEDKALFYAIGPIRREAPPRADQIDLSGLALASMVHKMRGNDDGIRVGSHRRMLIDYPDCFVARDAVDWISETVGLNRDSAVKVGRTMLQMNLIQHVFDEMHFEDTRELYRFV